MKILAVQESSLPYQKHGWEPVSQHRNLLAVQSPCLSLVAVYLSAHPSLGWQLWTRAQILMSLLFPLSSDQKERLQRGILIKAAASQENDIVEMGGPRIRAARTQGRAC